MDYQSTPWPMAHFESVLSGEHEKWPWENFSTNFSDQVSCDKLSVVYYAISTVTDLPQDKIRNFQLISP